MIEKIRELLFRIFKKESFIGKLIDKFFTKEIVSYIFFGVMTTIVNLAVFYVTKRFFAAIGWNGVFNTIVPENSKIVELFSGGSEYLDANLIAWIAGVVFAFVTNKLFVFESKSWRPSVAGKEFTGFMGARIFSLAVEMLGMFVMVTLLNWNELISKLVVGFIVIIINYVFSKVLIFKKSKART
ncbi:MAG: GtrA family protein [Clostridia bacterium]|nr:GtrA family protein [Clostridia bacterium]